MLENPCEYDIEPPGFISHVVNSLILIGDSETEQNDYFSSTSSENYSNFLKCRIFESTPISFHCGHVAIMEEGRSAFKILIGRPQGQRVSAFKVI